MNGLTTSQLKPMKVAISNGGGGNGGIEPTSLQAFPRLRRPMILLAVVCLIATMYKMASIDGDIDLDNNDGNDGQGGEHLKDFIKNNNYGINDVSDKSDSNTKDPAKTEKKQEKKESGENKETKSTNKKEKSAKASKEMATNAPYPLPPLTSLLNKEGKIKSDVSWLLNLIIVGFPKSGTTYLERNLNSRNSYLIHSEQCKLASNKTDLLIPILHQEPPANVEGLIRGIKCPRLLESEYALSNAAKYFPYANFMVSSRHPVLWFQSFYNFRSYKMYPKFDLTPFDLIGSCQREKSNKNSPYVCIPDINGCDKERTYNVCTDRAQFHHALSRFGKTPMNTNKELDLLDHHNMTIAPSKAKVFFIEIAQISDTNETRAKLFRDDLKEFLGISSDIPPLVHTHHEQYTDPKRQKYFINICDDQYASIREILMDHGKKASKWIREFFLQSPDVVVSSREYLEERLMTWTEDPCDTGEKL